MFYKLKKIGPVFLYFILVAFVVIPTKISEPTFHIGRVEEVHNNYVIVQNKLDKTVLYTRKEFTYDDWIMFDGEFTYIQNEKGFYNFKFDQYLHKKNIYYSINPSSVNLMKKSNSIRGKIFSYICNLDEETSAILKKTIFHISSDIESIDIFMDSGFSYVSILFFFKILFERILNEKRTNILLLSLSFVLCLFYHFPFSLTQYFIFRTISFFRLPKNYSLGISYLLIMVLFPNEILGISFIYPFLYRIKIKKKELRFLILSIVQSIYLNEINLFKLFFFQIYLFFSGCITVLSFFKMLAPFIPIHFIIVKYNSFHVFLNYFVLKGNPVGATFFVFIFVCLYCFKKKKNIHLLILLYYSLLGLGFFHPFGEVTFINVGQGDSILIRFPFNKCNILIDTGKSNKYSHLADTLNAKSIYTIHHLILTHYDEDHTGNVSALKQDYAIKEINDTHEDVCYKKMCLFEMNPIESENKNDSSLVFITRLNFLDYLFMGDATTRTEEQILLKYPNLSADILKAGHHGSKTSSSENWIQTIRPSLSIISAGNYSIYHHPSKEVLERFQSYKIDYLNTNEEGDISIFFVPFGNLLFTSDFKIIFLTH